MWIIPNTHTLYSAFALDMVVLNSASDLQALNIEQSLFARSKPSSAKTWWTRCKRTSYLQRLFGQTLSPCQWRRFETELTSSLAATHASHFLPQENAQEKMTPDTCGPTSETSSDQYDLLDASLKTSKDTSASDCEKSLAIWKASVIDRRGAYLARLSAARHIRESESISWPTPPLALAAQMGTPDFRQWPTPTTQDSNKATKKMRVDHQNNLTAVVFNQEMLPTPITRDHKGGYKTESLIRADGKSRAFDALPNAAIGGVGVEKHPGHLNPSWVEWLMGIPQGWTALIGD